MKASSIACALGIALAAAAPAAAAGSPGVVVKTAKGSFEDVKTRVVFAIEGRGMVLNYTAKIGDMLARTGKDIGRGRAVYANAELLEFCSAKLSRDVMEADPQAIVYCPYGIAVYTLPGEAGKVYVSYRELAPSATGKAVAPLKAVDKMLGEIVAEALR